MAPLPVARMVAANTVSRLTWAVKSVCTIAAACAGSDFGPGLIAEDAEGQHSGADRTVVGHDRRDERRVRGQVVGVELAHVHGRRARRGDGGHLVGQPIGAPRGEHHGGAAGQSRRQFDPDLAAAAEYHDQPTFSRVIHGCDYVLR